MPLRQTTRHGPQQLFSKMSRPNQNVETVLHFLIVEQSLSQDLSYKRSTGPVNIGLGLAIAFERCRRGIR